MNRLHAFGIIACVLFVSACASFVIKPVDYSWPKEERPKISESGTCELKGGYGIVFNALGLFAAERGDSNAARGAELRIIRNAEGYYFVTAPKFKHVYVFESEEGALSLEKKILVNENGLANPAMNQQGTNILLLDGVSRSVISKDGVRPEGGKQ